MNIEKKGNLRDTIFTTQTLLDAAIVMEQMVKPCAEKDIPLYNLSDGLYLEWAGNHVHHHLQNLNFLHNKI